MLSEDKISLFKPSEKRSLNQFSEQTEMVFYCPVCNDYYSESDHYFFYQNEKKKWIENWVQHYAEWHIKNVCNQTKKAALKTLLKKHFDFLLLHNFSANDFYNLSFEKDNEAWELIKNLTG